MRRAFLTILAAASLAGHASGAGSVPAIVNYQGVLLESPSGSPAEGDRDMVFRFFDSGGNEILLDKHTRGDSAPVSVMAGLFNVALGTGRVEDGAAVLPNDPYDSLDKMFRDFPEILLQVEIRVGPAGGTGVFETLSPSTRITSAPYAINADLLDGKGSVEFIDRSTAPQTKAGDLTVANLTASGNAITFSSTGASLSSTSTSTFVSAGSTDTTDLYLVAGNSGDDGQILLFGDGPLELRSGNGTFSFFDGASTLERARLTSIGDLQIDGDLVATGGDITFGSPGAWITARPTSLSLFAGDVSTDDIFLVAGTSGADGQLSIMGGGDFIMRAGNGEFSFVNAATMVEKAHLDTSGNLQIDGSLTLVAGHSIHESGFGAMVLETSTGGSVAVLSDNVVQTTIDFDSNTTGATVDWCANGGCTGSNHLMELQEDGDLRIGGVLSQNQFDLAEAYLKGEPLEPGDLVRLHPGRKGAVLKSAGAGDATVLGVVSHRPGVVLGGPPFGVDRLESMWGADIRMRFEHEREGRMAEAEERGSGTETAALEAFYWDHFVPVALAGRVAVKVDTRFGEISAGDSLAPSPVAGVAMKSDGRGPIIAVALEPYSGGSGRIEAFVTRGSGPLVGPVDRASHPATVLEEPPAGQPNVVDRDGDETAHPTTFRDRQLEGTISELFPLSEPAGPGDLLAADSVRPGYFRPASAAADPAVVGVVASRPGLLLGGGAARILATDPTLAAQIEDAHRARDRQAEERLWRRLESSFSASHAPVAMTGTVQVKADAGYGAIRAGDLLCSSATPGHARRSDDPAPGTVVGKALEPLESGTGLIRMVVMMR